jgi:hypothetical protein
LLAKFLCLVEGCFFVRPESAKASRATPVKHGPKAIAGGGAQRA